MRMNFSESRVTVVEVARFSGERRLSAGTGMDAIVLSEVSAEQLVGYRVQGR